MTSIRLSHQVHASPEEVYDFADNTENYPDFFQGFGKVDWTEPRQRVGTSLKMEAKLGRTVLPLEFKTTEVVPGRRISGVFVSGLEGHFDWDFDGDEDTTWVTVSADYRLPSRVVMQPTERAAMDHAMCSSMLTALEAIKRLVESRKEKAA